MSRHPQVDNMQLLSPKEAPSEEVIDLLLCLKNPGPEAPRWYLSPGWRWVLKHLALGDVSCGCFKMLLPAGGSSSLCKYFSFSISLKYFQVFFLDSSGKRIIKKSLEDA